MPGKPLVHRPRFYNFFPQPPRGFLHIGHHKAKLRYLKKLSRGYTLENIEECPICGGRDFRLLATQERHGLPIQANLCLCCALVFNSPRLSLASLSDHYRKDYREIERGTPGGLHPWMFELQGSKAPLVMEALNKAGIQKGDIQRIADVGCGEGGLLFNLFPNHDKIGFELNYGASAYGRSRGLDITADPLSREKGLFDLILYEQVLEHVCDPNAELTNIASVQEIGSYLYIGVPGLMAFPQHYNHNFIDYLEYGHFWHFHLATLERLLAKHGYQMLYGDEAIRSVFKKVGDKPIMPTLPAVSPDKIVALIETEERIFAAKSHFFRHIRGYAAYAGLALAARLMPGLK